MNSLIILRILLTLFGTNKSLKSFFILDCETQSGNYFLKIAFKIHSIAYSFFQDYFSAYEFSSNKNIALKIMKFNSHKNINLMIKSILSESRRLRQITISLNYQCNGSVHVLDEVSIFISKLMFY